MVRFRSGAAITAMVFFVSLQSGAGRAQDSSPKEAARTSPAAASLGVERLVELALARNADLLSVRQRVEESRGVLVQSGLRPNPTLEVNAGGGGPLGSSGENELTLLYSHVFEMGGRRDRRVAAARLAVDMAELSVTERERQLRADVKARYGEALAAIRNLESTRHLLDLSRQSLRIAAARTRQGEAAPLEEALIQVEVNRLQSDQVLFENQVQRALLELKSLAGLSLDTPLQVSGELAVPAVTLSLAEALGRAVGQRPDLKLARAEAGLGEAEMLLAKAEAVPNVVLSAGYSRVSSRFDQLGYSSKDGSLVPLRDTDNILVGGISIALPVRNRNQGNIQAALARRQGSLLREQYLEQLVRREVESAYGRYEAVSRAVRLFDQGVVRQAENNLSVLRDAYDLGEIRLLDVINEQRRLVEIEKSYTEILRESYLAVTDLERVVGAPIF